MNTNKVEEYQSTGVYKVTERPPEEDVNVLAYIPGIGWRVCYLFDNRWTYAVNEKWGFDVTHWRYLDEDPE
jgi:hypothetical protein